MPNQELWDQVQIHARLDIKHRRLFLEVMFATALFVTLPGSRRLHCSSSDLRSSAGLGWGLLGI